MITLFLNVLIVSSVCLIDFSAKLWILSLHFKFQSVLLLFFCSPKLVMHLMSKYMFPRFYGFKDIWERLQHHIELECRISGDCKGWMDDCLLN